MSQRTLLGEEIPIISPISTMAPKEKIIYNYLKACESGRTEKQIQNALAYTKVSTFGNKLRNMRARGWVRTWKPSPDEDQLWYAVEAK